MAVDARRIHGLSCRKSAQTPETLTSELHHLKGRKDNSDSRCEGASGLSCDDGKRHDGATLILWARRKAVAWDVTVVDTFA